MDELLSARKATPGDAETIASIYNEGIADRIATFETRLRSAADVRSWFDGVHPVVVVEQAVIEQAVVEQAAIEQAGQIVAFAATFPYRPRECYSGVAEGSVYVARSMRGRGAGRLALNTLIDAAREQGFWKLVSRIFVENQASRRLIRTLGFREVGVYEKHGKLDGVWRDVVIVERLIPANFT